MRNTRLATSLAVTALAVAACGTSTADTSGTSEHTSVTRPSPPTARSWAERLLAQAVPPPGARRVTSAPIPALRSLPAHPATSGAPIVLKRWWTVDRSVASVVQWIQQHTTGLGTPAIGDSPTWLGYTPSRQSLPVSIGVGDLFFVVAPVTATRTGIAAVALTMAQPQRPAAEDVPVDVTRVVIRWSLAPGGTPVQKVLTGPAAMKLVRDFDSLRVSTAGNEACPMIPYGSGVTVTFVAGSQSWHADVVPCPGIEVTQDGHSLPTLAWGQPFIGDVKAYVGRLPQSGPPSAGGVVPLVQARQH